MKKWRKYTERKNGWSEIFYIVSGRDKPQDKMLGQLEFNINALTEQIWKIFDKIYFVGKTSTNFKKTLLMDGIKPLRKRNQCLRQQTEQFLKTFGRSSNYIQVECNNLIDNSKMQQ